ncbi:MAG: hypothetical protein B6244_13795 [Candidatus Cloacimonetes bacterium 4572_55]|nr:MAG: hypothetical protein B6244_13795 [Candidatus Cloacimonetes bacterium 4572_55]
MIYTKKLSILITFAIIGILLTAQYSLSLVQKSVAHVELFPPNSDGNAQAEDWDTAEDLPECQLRVEWTVTQRGSPTLIYVQNDDGFYWRVHEGHFPGLGNFSSVYSDLVPPGDYELVAEVMLGGQEPELNVYLISVLVQGNEH